MSENATTTNVRTNGPNYLGWRGELLARLALSRIPSLTVYESPEEHGYDFLVVTEQGFCFFVEVKAFSSIRSRVKGIETIGELRWRIQKQAITRAHECQSPVVLFLFDADTDHGRFLRLDTVPNSRTTGSLQTIRLPIVNTITEESLRRLIQDLVAG